MSTPPPNDINKLIPWVRTQKFETKSSVNATLNTRLATHKAEVEEIMRVHDERIKFLEEEIALLKKGVKK